MKTTDEWEREIIERVTEGLTPEGAVIEVINRYPQDMGYSAEKIVEYIRMAGIDFVSTTEHFVDISDKGFAVQHSTECRPNMLDCRFQTEAAKWIVKPAKSGRYRMVFDEDDILRLDEI